MSQHGNSLWVYGAGGMGREVAAELEGRFLGYLVDGQPAHNLKNGQGFVPGVGDGRLREKLAERGKALGLELTSFVSAHALHGESQAFPPGCLVMRGAMVTCDVKLGVGVLLNTGCIIPHDCEFEDWSTVQPGATLTGRIHLHRYATIGAGATVVCRSNTQPLVIGEGAFVGAGALVLHDVKPNTTVVGNPARVLTKGVDT